jgi:hypothetical protein
MSTTVLIASVRAAVAVFSTINSIRKWKGKEGVVSRSSPPEYRETSHYLRFMLVNAIGHSFGLRSHYFQIGDTDFRK